MIERNKQVLDGEPAEPDPVLAEIDNLISTAESRIELQREYVRSVVPDFGCSMKAIADLDTMTSALETLKRQRAQIVRWEHEHYLAAWALGP